MACNLNLEEGHFDYLPSVQVENLENIPPGLSGETFETSMCAGFRYIGKHHYYEINQDVVSMMYNAVSKFAQDDNAKYNLMHNKSNFVRIDERLYNGTYCQMEWYSPVLEKQEK